MPHAAKTPASASHAGPDLSSIQTTQEGTGADTVVERNHDVLNPAITRPVFWPTGRLALRAGIVRPFHRPPARHRLRAPASHAESQRCRRITGTIEADPGCAQGKVAISAMV